MAIKNFLYNFFLRIANIFKEENITEREGKSEVAESEKKLFFKHGEEKEQSVSLYTTKEEAGDKCIQIKINDEIFYASLSEIKPEDFISVLILESNGKRFYLTKAAEKTIGETPSEEPVTEPEEVPADKVFDNTQTFTSSGTFTVPDGVTEIYVTASAGGGGGGGGPIWEVRAPVPAPRPINPGTNGTSGGNTIIDSLLTLNGGGGGTACDGYNNTHSANGKSYDNKIENDTYKNYGNGGNGAEHPNGTYKAGTGGKGQNCYKTKITVSPGQKISITIGQGGTGGTGSYPGTMPDNVKNGSNGQSGFALIEWDTPKPKELTESKTITIDMNKEWWTCPEGVNNIEIKESSTAKELIIKVTAGYKYKFGYKSEAYYDSDGIVCEEDYLLIENNHSHQDEINFYSTSYPGDEGDDNSYVTYKLIITYSPEINKKTPKYSAD